LILVSFGVSDIPDDVPAHPKEKNARRISASSRFTIFIHGYMLAASSSRTISTNFNIIMGTGLFYPRKENFSLFFGQKNGFALLRIRLGLNREIFFLRFSDFIRDAAIIGQLPENFELDLALPEHIPLALTEPQSAGQGLHGTSFRA
jgi:hypothetical protein